MRGKVWVHQSSPPVIRITPAYAGKSHSVQCNGQQTEDHPRLCGEKVAVSPVHSTGGGSPPPMRGKADLSQLFNGFRRITPAYAGKRH